ncbi:hypothetical protein [Paenibacillus sp. FSL R5-0470]|uniref:hypothetical protein n=1 Tax=Paenibacillus sp. FSL R5-0470 TaxID=2921641 RepID=UPI0030DCA9E4
MKSLKKRKNEGREDNKYSSRSMVELHLSCLKKGLYLGSTAKTIMTTAIGNRSCPVGEGI